jgi:hypothetical protein
MIITYIRSSSYNTHEMCPMQYFMEYVLGYRGPSGQKADKGTITHKVLEVLAVITQAKQQNQTLVVDDVVGTIDVEHYDLDTIIDTVYYHYSSNANHHKWKPVDHKDCKLWVYKALKFNDGMFDPRKRNIVCPEQHFDFEIKKPWAQYKYKINNKTLEGHLALKGTIDLVTKVNDSTLEIIDWKTGRRLDWATGQEKTQEKLENDAQLRIYHYAIKHLYPNIENVIFSIYFINDGGPFSVCFHDYDLEKTEEMLRKKFETIKHTSKPRLNKSWMCTKLCHFGKTTFENTHIEPLIEYRDGQVCKNGSCMTKCEQTKHDLDLYGIDAIVSTYTNKNHNVGSYKAPGTT